MIDKPVSVLHRLVLEEELHLAIGTFSRPDSETSRTRLISDVLCLLCRTDHPTAKLNRPRWKDISGLPLITLQKGNGIRDLLEAAYASAQIPFAPAFELEQVSTIVSLVHAGFGISVLPPYALAVLPILGLTARPLGPPQIGRSIEAIYRADRSLSPAAVQFIKIARRLAGGLRKEF